MKVMIEAVERGLAPDALTRAGIRRLLARRLEGEHAGGCEQRRERQLELFRELRGGPVAVATDAANRQHYELPAAFFERVLGPHLKYSACWWPDEVGDLAEAEERTLELTVRRAGIEDGMSVLDLGCGWGSTALYVARRFPACRVLAVSNSRTQGDLIRERAAAQGLVNLEIRTADMRWLELEQRFDRIVSVEMFEHLRNWDVAFRRIARWLEPDGRMLLHVFCHRELAYLYEDRGSGDWMARHFFTGGMMPSDDQPYHFQRDLAVRHHWRLDGRHYQRTLDAWLDRMDRARPALEPLFRTTYGDDWRRWWHRWRIFFMACSELFGYRRGQEWWVSHYLLERQADAAREHRRRAEDLAEVG